MLFVRLPESTRRRVEEEVRTVPAQRLLVICLPVPEPMESVLDEIRTFVVIVLPPGMQERLDPMEGGPWRREYEFTRKDSPFRWRHSPGHRPTTLPSALPSLYHERHFSANTVCTVGLFGVDVSLRKAQVPSESMPDETFSTSYDKGISSATTYLDVLVEVPHDLGLHLHALQAVALQLSSSLHCIHHLLLNERNQHSRRYSGVRPQRHEHIRETVHRDGKVRDRIWLPLLVDVDPVTTNYLERKLEGCVVTCNIAA